MDIFWAVFLGLVQGVSEFIPVSSSGHLVIFQSLSPSFVQPGVLFDVVLHMGTVLAVVFYFGKKIINLLNKYFWLLLMGTIPAGFVGFFFRDQIELLFGNIKVVGSALLITALLNFATDRKKGGKKNINGKKALLIGIAQALAIIPGISRSGATIFAGTTSEINKERAAEFSFLLSLPAILGANILQIISHGAEKDVNYLLYILGFLAAFVSGFISINLVLKTLHRKKFKIFGFYCLIAGVLVLLA